MFNILVKPSIQKLAARGKHVITPGFSEALLQERGMSYTPSAISVEVPLSHISEGTEHITHDKASLDSLLC